MANVRQIAHWPAYHEIPLSLLRAMVNFTADVFGRSKSSASRRVDVSAVRMGPIAATTADPNASPVAQPMPSAGTASTSQEGHE